MRLEKDSLGKMEVPDDVYYGIQTLRAVRNFPVSGIRANPNFIRSLAIIKKAAVNVNAENGLLEKDVADAINTACDEIIDGGYKDQFVVDVFQAGAGTSQNMNMNEVIANRAAEILSEQKGKYDKVHPNDHVNMGQSTNDVFPTAMRISVLLTLPALLKSLNELEKSFGKLAVRTKEIITSGRTHLQDALPVTMGQTFSSYARAILSCKKGLAESSKALMELGIGGTAVGSGLNASTGYRYSMVALLSGYTGIPFKSAPDLFFAMNSMEPFSRFSASLRNLGLELTKIANDIRLLSSGPNTGLNEINLPAVQPGSSIMPGKINPVMAEMLNMVCFQVLGNDHAVSMAVQAGQLQLNVMMPVIIFNILWSMDILTNALNAFTTRCVDGIEVNKELCKLYAEKTLGLGTILNSIIGYRRAAEVVAESRRTGKSIRSIILEKKLLKEKELENLFKPENLTEPGIPGEKLNAFKKSGR